MHLKNNSIYYFRTLSNSFSGSMDASRKRMGVVVDFIRATANCMGLSHSYSDETDRTIIIQIINICTKLNRAAPSFVKKVLDTFTIFECVLEKSSFKFKINQTKISKPPPHIQTKIKRKKTFVKPVQQNAYVIGLTIKRSFVFVGIKITVASVTTLAAVNLGTTIYFYYNYLI